MKKAERLHVLPPSLPPFGVDRVQAAALLGIGETLFDQCVENGSLPQPRVIGGRNVYDVSELHDAFKRMPHRAGRTIQNVSAGIDGAASGGFTWEDA